MDGNTGSGQPPRSPIAFPFYYGWFIVALSFLANLTAAGIRSAPSVLIHPLEAEFGWSRTAIASAASLNLLLLGLFAPVGGWLIDRVGARRVILACLTTIAAGLIGTVFVRELWQLIFLWGVVLGIATGVTPALGASIASRWFVHRRARKDRDLFIAELVKVNQEKFLVEREAAEWHRKYRHAALSQRIDVYHHNDPERLPGDEWKEGL